jgi:hypothetical protein
MHKVILRNEANSRCRGHKFPMVHVRHLALRGLRPRAVAEAYSGATAAQLIKYRNL